MGVAVCLILTILGEHSLEASRVFMSLRSVLRVGPAMGAGPPWGPKGAFAFLNVCIVLHFESRERSIVKRVSRALLTAPGLPLPCPGSLIGPGLRVT